MFQLTIEIKILGEVYASKEIYTEESPLDIHEKIQKAGLTSSMYVLFFQNEYTMTIDVTPQFRCCEFFLTDFLDYLNRMIADMHGPSLGYETLQH